MIVRCKFSMKWYELMADSWIQAIIWIMLFCPGSPRSESYSKNLINAENLGGSFGHQELVVPKVYHGKRLLSKTLTQDGHVRNITVIFHAFGQDFVLDFHLNMNLFSDLYVEKAVYEAHHKFTHLSVNHNESHCFYQGRLRGQSFRSSSAAVSTCHGIRGQISLKDQIFFIEPINDSQLSSIHSVLRDSDYLHRNGCCGQDTQPRKKRNNVFSQARSLRDAAADQVNVLEPSDADEVTRYVELYIVNDFSQYAKMRYKKEAVIQRTKEIINIVCSIYRPLNIYIVLVGIEVWIERDLILNNGNSETTLNQFLEYRRKHINPIHRNDNAQLITGKELGTGIVGKAPIMTICTYKTSGGVNADQHSNLGAISTTVAHELGHNFGLYHDTDNCDCEDSRCVMSSGGGVGNPTKWSSCSKQELADNFHQGMDYCLQNMPQVTSLGATCGNGFTEDGEECDCGLEQDCNNRCCVASSCRLAPNATCASGHCCDLATCQPKEVATVCREPRGSCDLPEFCDGKSERCPSDAYREDGVECEDNWVTSYCYQGSCRTHDGQCRMLWGRTGKVAHSRCFEHFNVMGNANGHCGFNWVNESFQKCEAKDVLCGMLHCDHQSEKLMFWKEALMYTMPDTFIWVNKERQDCKATIMDVGLDMPDPGMTFDGVKCGEDKICLSHRCVSRTTLNIPSCPNCHGHGVCNNLGQCHCDKDYSTPYCDKPGVGGSIHSGPAQKYPPNNVKLTIGLCLLFLVIIPSFVVLAILSYRHYDRVKVFLLQRCQRCQASTFLRKRMQKNARPMELSAPEVTVVSNCSPSDSAKASSIRRAVSFRLEDISNPLLQSSTNTTVNIFSTGKTPASLTHASSCRATVNYTKVRSPGRTVPKEENVTSASNRSISSHGSDFSSASGASTDVQYLLPKENGYSNVESCKPTQPLRPAPPPPYACPKKNLNQRDSLASKTPNKIQESAENGLEMQKTSDKVPAVSHNVSRLPVNQKFGDSNLSDKKSLAEAKAGSQAKTKGALPSGNVSQLRTTFERNDSSTKPQPSSNVVSASRDASHSFQPGLTNRAMDAPGAGRVQASASVASSKAVPPKRPPPLGRPETFNSGSGVKPAISKLNHSASDVAQSARPSLAPKPPTQSKLTISNS